MPLDYLDFDYSEEEDGTGSWDAMASVTSARLPALTAEVQALLHWAHQQFAGRRGPLEDGGDWDYELQARADDGTPLAVHFDGSHLHIAPSGERTTLSLTLSASAAFSDALRARYGLE